MAQLRRGHGQLDGLVQLLACNPAQLISGGEAACDHRQRCATRKHLSALESTLNATLFHCCIWAGIRLQCMGCAA